MKKGRKHSRRRSKSRRPSKTRRIKKQKGGFYAPLNTLLKSTPKAETWAILQYDNRPISAEIKELLEINKKYAKKHGYQHFLLSDPYFMPPYWIKVALLQRFLDAKDPQTGNPLFKGILYLDTDAVIVDHAKSLDAFMEGKKPFVAGPDITYGTNPNDSPFNAGVFVVKNTDDIKPVIKEWLEQYHTKEWYYENGQWSTPTRWAGPAYEQGSFAEKILPKYKNTLVEIVDNPILQATFDEMYPNSYKKGDGSFTKNGIFVMHFSADKKGPMLSKFLKAYKS